VQKSRINWDQVKERLRADDRALQEALTENAARIDAAYRWRAAHLAVNQGQRGPRIAAASALVFRLNEERYAIELTELAEVLPFKGCMPVPGAAPEFLGVINLRGELRPIVDLARMLLHVESGTLASGFVLMLRRTGREIGLKVDHVEGLCEIGSKTADSAEQRKYSTRIAGETLLLLDVERVLAEIFSAEESLTA
jgi:purine-binding chemotaxis protein CheW